MDPGVSNPKVIDLITRSPKTGDFTLIMVQDRAWDGLPEHLLELQQKVNSYLSFGLDGELHKKHPDSASKRVVIQLDCDDAPDRQTAEFIEQLKAVTRKSGIEFIVNVR